MNILTDLGMEDLVHLLPSGVVEQRERRPRLICDYSFYEVNQDTHQIGPEEAMQFARELERLMYTMWHANPRFGPVYMGKVDLTDGFYRLQLALSAMLKLVVIFSSYPDEEELIALPFTSSSSSPLASTSRSFDMTILELMLSLLMNLLCSALTTLTALSTVSARPLLPLPPFGLSLPRNAGLNTIPMLPLFIFACTTYDVSVLYSR